MRLVEDLEYAIGSYISRYYWDPATDHEDYNKILNAICHTIGQCSCVNVIQELHKAGFKIVRIEK